MGVATVLEPLGYHSGTCGYCSEPGKRSVERSSYSTGAWPLQMTCGVYQRMIDRGWRRSGEYLYKPDLLHSCCPQYTIRLGALEFSPSKNQRKIVSKWNRFVIGEGSPKGKQSTKHPLAFSLVEALHASEAAFLAPNVEPLHQFTVTLEPPSFTQEKYDLYCRYQSEVHKDYDKSIASFSRFLIDNPLRREPIAYLTAPPAHLPSQYGAYHQIYRLDGELIAFGVVDVLPNCISSVYLVYSPKWAWASLGKLSALHEIALVHEINRYGIEDMKWQYMGFYVHSCAKMRYKGDYSPSFLLDPETYSWHGFEASKAQLDRYPYISFSTPDHFRGHPPVPERKYSSALSDSEEEGDGFLPQNLFPLSLWNRVKIMVGIDDDMCAWTPAPTYGRWNEVQDSVSFVAHGLGEELSQEILFYVDK